MANLTNEYEVLREEVVTLNGDLGNVHDKYTAELEILKKLKEGGGGGGATIDDTTISTSKVWSSNKVNTELGGKQATISDLDTIRSGAAAGATALQSVPDTYATKAWVGEQGYLTEHQSLEDYSTTTQMNTAISTATADMATQTWVGQQGYLTQHQSLSNYYTKSESDALYAKVVTLTQAQYDALATKDPKTLYIISDAQ